MCEMLLEMLFLYIIFFIDLFARYDINANFANITIKEYSYPIK